MLIWIAHPAELKYLIFVKSHIDAFKLNQLYVQNAVGLIIFRIQYIMCIYV